jgi:hypothetical protein
MKRTFFIVVLAIFFTLDIFFAISTAVAENLKSSSNVEIMHPTQAQQVMLDDNTTDQFFTETVVQP